MPYREARQDQIPGVIDYVSASMRARRLLANCVTYMIFDDHEITDDWYMNEPWKERVIGKAGAGGRVGGRPAGRRVIANGRAAYGLSV